MIFLDLLLVIVIGIYLVSKKGIDFLNPALLFLIFHIIFVSSRSYQILVSGAGIISNSWYSSFITTSEIEKALIVADLTLLGFILGFVVNRKAYNRKGVALVEKFKNYEERSPQVINYFIIIAVVLGVFGTLSFAILPGQIVNLADTESSIYSSLLTNLGVISALILIYVKGFKRVYLLYFLAILVIFSIQGYHRYRVILPLLFLMGYYLKVNGLKMPPIKFLFLGFVIFVFSFPLKQIGRSLQRNETIDFVELGISSFNEIVEGESGDLSFLEQSAAMIGSMDNMDKMFYGETYVPILFFWMPRVYWDDKPKLNQWQYDISTPGRDYGQMGQISLLSGESYANFGYFGAFAIPWFVGMLYSKIYFYYRNINLNHKGFLLLLLMHMILFQVWRDGLISLIIFPIVNYLPLILLILLKRNSKA
jgi:oligosaccharide repeat unit polymerase